MSDLSITAPRMDQDWNQAQSARTIKGLQGDSHNKEKIEKSARDFESILVAQWLEQAEKSFATVPGDDPDKKDEDPGQDQFKSIAFHSLADGMVKAGGFGIAKMITKHLAAAEAVSGAPDVSKEKAQAQDPHGMRKFNKNR